MIPASAPQKITAFEEKTQNTIWLYLQKHDVSGRLERTRPCNRKNKQNKQLTLFKIN